MVRVSSVYEVSNVYIILRYVEHFLCVTTPATLTISLSLKLEAFSKRLSSFFHNF